MTNHWWTCFLKLFFPSSQAVHHAKQQSPLPGVSWRGEWDLQWNPVEWHVQWPCFEDPHFGRTSSSSSDPPCNRSLARMKRAPASEDELPTEVQILQRKTTMNYYKLKSIFLYYISILNNINIYIYYSTTYKKNTSSTTARLFAKFHGVVKERLNQQRVANPVDQSAHEPGSWKATSSWDGTTWDDFPGLVLFGNPTFS